MTQIEKVRLVPRSVRRFDDPKAGLSLTIANPEGTPLMMTPLLERAIERGFVEVIDAKPAVIEEVDQESEVKVPAVDTEPEEAAKPKRTSEPKARCKATTAKGKPCKGKPLEGSKFCRTHQSKEDISGASS